MAHTQISVLSFTSCGSLDKFFPLSVPQFPHLERVNHSTASRVVTGIKSEPVLATVSSSSPMKQSHSVMTGISQASEMLKSPSS